MLPLLLLLLSPARGATLEVCPDGCSWTTIHEALEAAVDGDTIAVAAGTYEESLDIDESVDIVGEGSALTVLQGPGTLVTIRAGASVGLSGLTLGVAEDGRGVDVRDSEALLMDLVVSDVTTSTAAAGLYAEGSTVSLYDSAFEGITAMQGQGGAIAAYDSTLEVVRGTFTSCLAQQGGAVYAERSTVSLEDTEASGCQVAVNATGATTYYETDATHVGVDFHDNGLRDSLNGAVYSSGGSFSDTAGSYAHNQGSNAAMFMRGPVRLTGTTFTGNSDESPYGMNTFRASGSTVELREVSFTSNQSGNTIELSLVEEAVIDGCTFTDNGQPLWVSSSNLTLTDSVFSTSWSHQTLSYTAHEGEEVTLRMTGNAFVETGVDGVGLSISSHSSLLMHDNLFCGGSATPAAVFPASGASTTISNNRFVGNEVQATGGISMRLTGTIRLTHNHFVGNQASSYGSALTLSPPIDLEHIEITDNLFAHQRGDAAVVASASIPADDLYFDYNLYWDDEAGDLNDDIEHGEHDVFEDPSLGWVSGMTCEELLVPACPGPAIDAGDPDVQDPDGSRSDIGAYGGPDAPAELFEDGDGDGWRLGCDCDDEDASVHPEAEDLPGDGIDQDCDGADAEGEPDSGLDDEPGCGCGAPASAGWVWVLLPGLVVARRRRLCHRP